MRTTMRLQLAAWLIVLPLISLLSVGCSEEPGRVRVRPDQLVGVYEAALDNGRERLELKSDGTYIQEFEITGQDLRHTGKWKVENNFLDGSDVTLSDAIASKNPVNPSHVGEQILNVHRRSGKFSLALNETADWYFERVP